MKNKETVAQDGLTGLAKVPMDLVNDPEKSMFISRYIEPTNDWAFKNLFGPTSDGKLLKSFLNAIFPTKNILEIEYLNTEYPGMSEESRKAITDVQCKTDNGEEFIVEIQNGSQKWFRNRALYYSTFPIQQQARKGRYKFDFQSIYFVGILNFALGDEEVGDSCIERFRISEEKTFKPMTSAIEWVYVHLKKFDLEEDDIRTMSDKWLFALKNMRKLMDKPKQLKEGIFIDLFDRAEFCNLNACDQETYLKNMMNEYDLRNCLEYSKEQGLKAGLEEGREEASMEIAQKLLARGVALEIISGATGLTPEQIKTMK